MSGGILGQGADFESCPRVRVVRLGREGTRVGPLVYWAEELLVACATCVAFGRRRVVDFETDSRVGLPDLMGRRGMSAGVWCLHE